MLRVLKVSPSDPLLWSKQLRNYEVSQRQIYIYMHIFLGKVTALGVLCCFALLFV